MLTPAAYTSFEELAEYAEQRAIRSAARNGHQEFTYWMEIANWATVSRGHEPRDLLPGLTAELESVLALPNWWRRHARQAALSYAKHVHCRKMLRARGEGVGKSSLAWLKAAARALQDERKNREVDAPRE
jgi:hypothetical protein